MLALEQLQIAQGDFRLTAYFDIDFGASVALIGPSGSGKSTLLSTIAGFVTPEAGRIFWDKVDITDARPADRPLTQLFQEHNLFAHLSVAQNVGLGLRPDLRLDAAAWRRVSAALDEVGLPGVERRRPAQLSGGQRSRVALARALLRDRPLLLLDEPFSALGPALRMEMLDLVDRIRAERRMTLILVTHEPDDARRIAEMTILIDKGQANPPQPTQALFESPPPELAAYLGGARS